MEGEPEGGISLSELRVSLKEVRNNKALKKLDHQMNIKSRVVKKVVNLSTMEADLKAKGFDVNTESLRSRSKVRRSISEIEKGQDRLAGHVLDDSDDGDVIEDEDIAM